ncbi:hypothetical protein BWR59_16020 [Pseudomonas sp. Bc-h]|uniref:hypothetical protein n=1 Tax=Pseudomonas sp. Bc-h TaxID=1943632 RepID=UPI0009D986B7|nr:hypothetical protein [Pseudomonas sp. Bc-h]OQR31016.1 hypothetical protein BWR59_16020 [Pseudomonas sp. Bc-h]
MKSEFNNRINAQREVISTINKLGWNEELLGLSSGGIARWALANRISMDDPLHTLVVRAAEKLFFLANKSQEQITDEYRNLSTEVTELILQIKKAAMAR